LDVFCVERFWVVGFEFDADPIRGEGYGLRVRRFTLERWMVRVETVRVGAANGFT
jgi:hypothetical protein